MAIRPTESRGLHPVIVTRHLTTTKKLINRLPQCRCGARLESKGCLQQHLQLTMQTRDRHLINDKKKASATEQVASAAVAQDEADKDAMPPPTTPNTKRPRVTRNTEKPPPFTPTPAAIGLMTNARTPNYSSGDIDGASPPPNRRVEAGHANANLITPGEPKSNHPTATSRNPRHPNPQHQPQAPSSKQPATTS